jgi:hypothetical protein
MARKKPTPQQCRKHYDKVCYFCPEDRYELLDAHRILEGANGGTYHWANMLTLCCKCHRKEQAGIIKILGSHPCSNGRRVIHYVEDGEEKWK